MKEYIGRHKYLKNSQKDPTSNSSNGYLGPPSKFVAAYLFPHSLSLISLQRLQSFHYPLNSRAKAANSYSMQYSTIQYKPHHSLRSPFQFKIQADLKKPNFSLLSFTHSLMVLEIQMWKPFSCKLLLVMSLVMIFAHFGLAKDQGNVANEIVDLINQNRSASKLPKLLDSKGLGCMALQYISECIGNCGSNNTLKCQPPEVDITEVYAPNCGVELPTVETISGQIVGCQWKYLNPEEAFSQILISDKKSLSLLHSKEHTEVGVGLRRVKKGASFWCILFSSGRTNASFVLEGGGRGIEQKNGCFSGTDRPCSAGRQVKFLDDTMLFTVVVIFYAFVLGV